MSSGLNIEMIASIISPFTQTGVSRAFVTHQRRGNNFQAMTLIIAFIAGLFFGVVATVLIQDESED